MGIDWALHMLQHEMFLHTFTHSHTDTLTIHLHCTFAETCNAPFNAPSMHLSMHLQRTFFQRYEKDRSNRLGDVRRMLQDKRVDPNKIALIDQVRRPRYIIFSIR